jgi:hypothetical protein
VTRHADASALARRLLLSLALLVCTGTTVVRAQAPAGPSPEPGSELTVFVVTVGQGDQVWERYGHNALWIRDDARGTNRAYNWGVFDASDPRFIVRFVRGRMRYWLETVDIGRLLEFYRSFDRSITVQRLALTPAQRVALRDFVEWNAREENKYYWYDYFRDNCSTRLRDAVNQALGGALLTATSDRVTANTYRSESVRLMEGMPLTQLGIELGLGPLTDRPLTAWEEMFVPMRMRDRLRGVRVRGPDGAPAPLVAEERQIYVARRPPEIQQVPPLVLRYAAIGAIVGAFVGLLGWLTSAERRIARVPFATIAAAWGVLTGVGGLLLLFLWVGTHHIFASRNENLLHLNPLALGLAVLAPLSIYRPDVRRAAQLLAAAVVAISLFGLMLDAVGLSDQSNLPVAALVLPSHLALAWALARLRRTVLARNATPAGSPAPAVSRASAAPGASSP